MKAVKLLLALGLVATTVGACGQSPTTDDSQGTQNDTSAPENAEQSSEFRHAQTEKDYADQADPNMRLDDCETQRKLSDVGIQQAKDIGAAFTEKAIPVGEVISSEYCHAWQTAELAFGRYEKNAKLNFLPFEEYTDAQVEEMKANVTPLLTAVPASGQNTVIVGHDDIFEAATGIYPAPQGMAYVLTPDGNGGFELVANMLPEEWAKL